MQKKLLAALFATALLASGGTALGGDENLVWNGGDFDKTEDVGGTVGFESISTGVGGLNGNIGIYVETPDPGGVPALETIRIVDGKAVYVGGDFGGNTQAAIALTVDNIVITDTGDQLVVKDGSTLTTSSGNSTIGDGGILTVESNATFTNGANLNNAGAISLEQGGAFNNTGTVMNEGTIKLGDATTVTATAGSIDNAGGDVEMTGGMNQTQMSNFLNALDTDDVGDIKVTGAFAANTDFSLDADAGTITLENTFNDAGTIFAGTVDVGDADLILNGDNNQVDGEIYANDITFNGENGIYNPGSVITAQGAIVIAGKDNVFTDKLTADTISIDADTLLYGGIESRSTTLAAGNKAQVFGLINSDFEIEGNATLQIEGETVIASGKTLTGGENSIIEFTNNLLNPDEVGYITVAEGGTLNLDSSTTLKLVGDNLVEGREYVILTQAAIDSLILDGVAATDTALNSYLASQSTSSITKQEGFSLNPDGNIVASNTYYELGNDAKNQELWNDALRANGLWSKRDMIDPGVADMMYKYVDMTETNLDGKTDAEKYLARMMSAIAGGRDLYDLQTSGLPGEAVSILQWSTGMDLAGTLEAVTDVNRSFGKTISRRAYNSGRFYSGAQYDECGRPVDCETNRANRVWAGYNGQWNNVKSRQWDDGYKYNSHGVDVGYDLFSRSGLNLGAAFGYNKGDYENKTALADDSKIENYSVGFYAGYTHASGVFFSAMGTYTRSEYNMKNRFSSLISDGNNGWDIADYKGNTWSAGGVVGYDYRPFENLTVTPTLGVYHYSSKTKNFDTSTRGNMKYSRTQTEMPAEVTVRYDLRTGIESTLSIVATGGYAYNFTDKGTKVHSFDHAGEGNVAGGTRYVKPGRSTWNYGAGVQFRYRALDLGAHYEFVGRRASDSHNLSAFVGVSF